MILIEVHDSKINNQKKKDDYRMDKSSHNWTYLIRRIGDSWVRNSDLWPFFVSHLFQFFSIRKLILFFFIRLSFLDNPIAFVPACCKYAVKNVWGHLSTEYGDLSICIPVKYSMCQPVFNYTHLLYNVYYVVKMLSTVPEVHCSLEKK